MAPKTPNPGGKGPKVTKETGNKGPIFGKPTSFHGTTQPVDWNKGQSKSLNTGKNVKKR